MWTALLCGTLKSTGTVKARDRRDEMGPWGMSLLQHGPTVVHQSRTRLRFPLRPGVASELQLQPGPWTAGLVPPIRTWTVADQGPARRPAWGRSLCSPAVQTLGQGVLCMGQNQPGSCGLAPLRSSVLPRHPDNEPDAPTMSQTQLPPCALSWPPTRGPRPITAEF